jgi:hypothetical protein
MALVAEEHLREWVPGADLLLPGQQVHVLPADMPVEEQQDTRGGPPPPLLWRTGRLGGRATINCWKRCGRWFGPKPLQLQPWTVEAQAASILLLEQDGSTGLDLSFATHLFLLERIDDPALRNQIVSRAHRIGATRSLDVRTVLCKAATSSI